MEINWEGIAVFPYGAGRVLGDYPSYRELKVKRAEKRYDIELERLRRETDERQRLHEGSPEHRVFQHLRLSVEEHVSNERTAGRDFTTSPTES